MPEVSFQLTPLVDDLDQAISKGLIAIQKYVKEGDGKKQVSKLDANRYKLHDQDGIDTDGNWYQSGGIKVSNTSQDRYFLFTITTANTGYFEDAGAVAALSDADSQIMFTLGPNMRFEIDVDSNYTGLDVCYLEAAYLTGEYLDNGKVETGGIYKDFDTKHEDNVTIELISEIRVEQLPLKGEAFETANKGFLVDLAKGFSQSMERVTGYDEGRDIARKNPYNTVKVRLLPGATMPTLVREVVPGFPTEYGVNFTDGLIMKGPGTSLFPGDNPGEVYSVSKNIPSWLYPFTKEDGGRYGVMELAEAEAPDVLKLGVIESIAGNEIERMGDLPYFRYWGDYILLAPMAVSAVAVGIGIYFIGPMVIPPAINAVRPLATNFVKVPVAVGRAVISGTKGVAESVMRIPETLKSGFSD